MEEKTFTIDLGNGTVLEDITLNGTNYVTQEEITEETFDGMENIVITDSEGGVQEIAQAELLHVKHFEDGYYFVLHEYTEAEIKEANNDAQIFYTAVMTDTLMEA